MKKSKLKTGLIIAFAVSTVIIAWVQILTSKNENQSLTPAVFFTFVMAFGVWAAFGFPLPWKKKAMNSEEFTEYLSASGFSATNLPSGNAYPQTSVYEKNGVSVEVFVFETVSSANGFFGRMCSRLCDEAGNIIYEGKMTTSDRCKYIIKTDIHHDVVLLKNSEVFHIGSNIDSEKEIEKLLKEIHH